MREPELHGGGHAKIKIQWVEFLSTMKRQQMAEDIANVTTLISDYSTTGTVLCLSLVIYWEKLPWVQAIHI